MSMARTCMHAHMVAHVHTRAHAKEDTYTPAHTARTRNIRTRTCAPPGSTYTRHWTFENRQPSPHSSTIIYHRRLVCIATSRVAPPATRWPTVHLHHATPKGREMRESENRPSNARRACTCCPESDDSCVPVCIAASRVAPPATRSSWPTMHLHASRRSWPTSLRCACSRPVFPYASYRGNLGALNYRWFYLQGWCGEAGWPR